MKLVITESQAQTLFTTEGIIPDNWKQKAGQWAAKKAKKWGEKAVSSGTGKKVINKLAQSDVGKDLARTAVSNYQQQAADQMKSQFDLSPEAKEKLSGIDFETGAPEFGKFMKGIARAMETQPETPGEESTTPIIPKGNEMMHPLGRKVNIDSGYGPRDIKSEPRASKNHKAIDFNTPSGSPVYAPLDGKVVRAEDTTPWPDNCGGHVRLKHSNNLETKFCHLRKWTVRPGQKVKKGDIIGYSGGGDTDPYRGVSTGPHLHYAVVVNGVAVDPTTVHNNLV